jgi:integrase
MPPAWTTRSCQNDSRATPTVQHEEAAQAWHSNVLNATLAVRDHRLTGVPPRTGFFEREDYERVRHEIAVRAATRYARPDLVLYGWRVSEVLALEQRHLHLDEGDHGAIRLDAGTTKGARTTGNRDGRLVFLTPLLEVTGLTPEIRRLIDEQLARVGSLEHELGRRVSYLFPHFKEPRRGQRVDDFARAWRSACLRAGLAVKVEREGKPALIRTFRTRHDFRRTACRNLINAGIPEITAMSVTGHVTRATFDRYSIVSPAEKQEAARRLAAASEEAARRAASSTPAVVSLVPRLVPVRDEESHGTTGTVDGRAISAETRATVAVSV